jgi:hypothetical protein
MIETPRLRLIPCELHRFEAILADQKQLGRMLGVTVMSVELHGPASLASDPL